MNERDRELEAFSKFIGALEPWLCEVVLIGGWAHRLYRRHPLARRLAYLPLITLDGDVAVPRAATDPRPTASSNTTQTSDLGSIPIARSITHDDSIVLTPLDQLNTATKLGFLVLRVQVETVERLRECIKYYEKKARPSSRIAAKTLAADLEEDWRELRGWDVERWFERLPMYLLEEPKRQKVLKALCTALALAETGKL